MREERLLTLILGPVISEKATHIADKHRQYAFRVLSDANKKEVHAAVEHLFNVKVDSVQICRVKGKEKRFKQFVGHRKNWKKAYVALQDGYDINFSGME